MQGVARENEKIPTSRVRRTATVATLAASEAVKQFGTRAANVARGDEASEAAMARRQLETAKQIVAVLGTMKGAAMKLGQVMSFLDMGLVAEERVQEGGWTGVDRDGIHQLANTSDEHLVTVHVYAPPLTELVVYSTSAAETERRPLRYTLADDLA